MNKRWFQPARMTNKQMLSLDTQAKAKTAEDVSPCVWALLKNVLRGRHKGRFVIVLPLFFCLFSCHSLSHTFQRIGFFLPFSVRFPSSPSSTLTPGHISCFVVLYSRSVSICFPVWKLWIEVRRKVFFWATVQMRPMVLHPLCLCF